MIIYLGFIDSLIQDWNRHSQPSVVLTISIKQLLVSVIKWQVGSLYYLVLGVAFCLFTWIPGSHRKRLFQRLVVLIKIMFSFLAGPYLHLVYAL